MGEKAWGQDRLCIPSRWLGAVGVVSRAHCVCASLCVSVRMSACTRVCAGGPVAEAMKECEYVGSARRTGLPHPGNPSLTSRCPAHLPRQPPCGNATLGQRAPPARQCPTLPSSQSLAALPMGHPFHTLLAAWFSFPTPSIRMEKGQNACPRHLHPVCPAWPSLSAPLVLGMA